MNSSSKTVDLSMIYAKYLDTLEKTLNIKFKTDRTKWDTWEIGAVLAGASEIPIKPAQWFLTSLRRTPAAYLIQAMHKIAVGHNYKNITSYLRAKLSNRSGVPFCVLELIHLYVITQAANRKRTKWSLEENCAYLDELWGRANGEFFRLWKELLLYKFVKTAHRTAMTEVVDADLWNTEEIQKRVRTALKKAKKEFEKQLGVIQIHELPHSDWPDRLFLQTIKKYGSRGLGKWHMFPIEYTLEAKLFGKGE